ncbi:hypothetical protein FRC12_018275 [Ceratobasidium sp. 428]|nr:hypothetical protein FRC12_018275 [Ceratobasidium sp. 428]
MGFAGLDMTMALDRIVPESMPWLHTDEGPDDSVSHTKTSLIGPSLHIPITNNRLNLGTWQGIYLAEFRYALPLGGNTNAQWPVGTHHILAGLP